MVLVAMLCVMLCVLTTTSIILDKVERCLPGAGERPVGVCINPRKHGASVQKAQLYIVERKVGDWWQGQGDRYGILWGGEATGRIVCGVVMLCHPQPVLKASRTSTQNRGVLGNGTGKQSEVMRSLNAS